MRSWLNLILLYVSLISNFKNFLKFEGHTQKLLLLNDLLLSQATCAVIVVSECWRSFVDLLLSNFDTNNDHADHVIFLSSMCYFLYAT